MSNILSHIEDNLVQMSDVFYLFECEDILCLTFKRKKFLISLSANEKFIFVSLKIPRRILINETIFKLILDKTYKYEKTGYLISKDEESIFIRFNTPMNECGYECVSEMDGIKFIECANILYEIYLEAEEEMKISTELEEQKKLIQWASYNNQIKDCIFSIPNGGSRNVIEARNLKLSGVKAGVPDIFLPIARNGFHGLFIELKRIKRSKVSDKQNEMISILENNGYRCVVCYGADSAIEEINKYLGE